MYKLPGNGCLDEHKWSSHLWFKVFSAFSEGNSIRFTQSKDGNTKYIFIFDFPEDKLSLTKIAFSKNAKLQLLGASPKISWKQKGSGVEINIPAVLKKSSKHV
ncbi:MAG: alpha-L-fucosidase C-terminal domain-containing protein [Chitinophagaceae bacterium]